jgi:hypothetical protein
MKIAVECKSVLLQKALERFLAKHLVSIKQADIVVRDFKSKDRNFYISSSSDADLLKPFSKSQLILAIENKLKKQKTSTLEKPKKIQDKDFSILEKRIQMLTQEYQENILKAIKAFYG